jgi:sulfur-carrier protein
LITVYISGHLKDYTGRRRSIEISGEGLNICMLVEKLDLVFPGIKDRVFDDQDNAREFVNIFVNGVNIRDIEKESTNLKDGDTVHILPSVAGGQYA